MASMPVKGDIQLLVDALGLEATFKFTPQADGPEWTSQKILKLLADARVPNVPNRRIEEILQAFSKASSVSSEIVAKGQAPETGFPESAEWVDLKTPEAYLPFADDTVAEAEPPTLFRIRTDRRVTERIVKKPGALPFLPSREEKIVETEKVDVREAVAVDTRVLFFFWAAKGTRVASIDPARTGRPGKTIFGKPLPPPQAEETVFHLGRGLVREKGIVTTELSGFVRVGERWADVIPFGAGEHTMKFSEDGTTVLLDYKPGDKRLPPPDAEAILAEAVALGQASENLIPLEEASAALTRATRSGQSLTGFSLSCDRDGSARVDIAPDKLKATLTVYKGRGRGKTLELSMVSAALAGLKLKGVKVDRLKADVIAFHKGNETDLLDYPLVEGRSPVKGKDRTLVCSVAFLTDAQFNDYKTFLEKSPNLSRFAENLDAFPLSVVKRIALVKKGQEIARFSMPVAGQAGVDVFGTVIPAAQGNDPMIKVYENIRISQGSIESQDDGLLLLSDEEGMAMARVLPYKDAKVAVTVAEDGMTAQVAIERGYGLGRDLTLELAQESIVEAGVNAEIDLKVLNPALAQARDGKPVSNLVIARGTEPIPAGGYRLNWIVRLATGAAVTVRTDGSADYKNQDRSTIVVEGQILLELLAIGVEGQDGVDVLGGVIPAPVDPRVSPPPTFDDSIIEETKENGDKILKAGCSGELTFEKNNLSIVMAHKIKGDVGPATGNIRFPGPVAITGTILTGYAVVAGGAIIVTGAVEAALLSAEGNIKITEGIKGARRGTIRARTTIEAAFAEQALLLAVEDITLKNSALLCNIKTNGRLHLLGEKGHLIGGVCRVRKGMEVQNLGSANGARTQVSFGQDYLVQDTIEAEEREVERVKAMILQADKTMREQEKLGLDLQKSRANKLRLVKLLEKRSMRVFELREKFEEHFPAEIVVRGSIFAGVVIESHNRFHEIRQTKQKVAFSFDPQLGRIVERPLT